MSATTNSQAIGIVNQVVALVGQAAQLQQQIAAMVAQYTQLTLGTTLSALATITPNADGTLPAQSDATPSASHPISPVAYLTLNRAVVATDVESAVTALTAISNLILGQAVSQQGQMPQLVAKFTGS